jgi:hypothetical protein
MTAFLVPSMLTQEQAVGERFHVRLDVARVRLRGLRDRRVCTPDRRLEGVVLGAHGLRARYNHRLLEPIGNIPPAEAEAAYYSQIPESAMSA